MKQVLYMVAVVVAYLAGMLCDDLFTANVVFLAVSPILVFIVWFFVKDEAKIARRQRKQTRDFNKGRKPK